METQTHTQDAGIIRLTIAMMQEVIREKKEQFSQSKSKDLSNLLKKQIKNRESIIIMKNQRGGYRPGAGRKSAEEKGIEKRKAFNISLLPSIAHAFHKKHGRNWGRMVEEYMRKDLSGE